VSFIEHCRRLVALDTTSSNGNRSAIDYLVGLAMDFGFTAEVQEESLHGLGQANIIIRQGDRPVQGELMLQTHLDTVNPGIYSKWTKTASNPFNASIYGRKLYGLGVADTKIDFLCKLFAAKKLAYKKLNRSFVLVGTYGAQSSMEGALKLIRKKKIEAVYALIGEPTNLQLISSGQGLAVIEIKIPFSDDEKKYRFQHNIEENSFSQSKIFSGKAAHSTAPHLGENAIIKMFKFLEKIPSGIVIMEMDGGVNYNSIPSSAYLEFDLLGTFSKSIVERISRIWKTVLQLEQEFYSWKDESFVYPYPSLNIGQVRTTDDGVLITGSCRLLPRIDKKTYQKWMTYLEDVCKEIGAEFKILNYKPSFSSDSESDFIKGCSEELAALNRSNKLGKIVASTEASVFQRLGIECLVFGPGVSMGNSHEPNESVSLDDLEVATSFYSHILERFCL